MSNWHREHRGLVPRPHYDWSDVNEELGVRALELQQTAFPELVLASGHSATLGGLGKHTVNVVGKKVEIDARLLKVPEAAHMARLAVTLLDGPQRIDVDTEQASRQPYAIIYDTDGKIVEDKETIASYIETLVLARSIIYRKRKR